MIDGLGRGVPLRLTLAATAPAERGAPAAASAPAAAPRAVAANVGRWVRDMAAAPPVDTARVEALRQAVAAGSYQPDPEAIAAKMIALEAGSA